MDVFRRLFQAGKEHNAPHVSTVLGNLWNFRNRGCTDPRDRIFAIKHICLDALADEIIVNYNISVEELFTDLTLKIMRRDRSLKVLSACQPGKNFSKLPSWVPDWTVDDTHRPSRLLSRLGLTNTTPHKALPIHELVLPGPGDPDELCLHGYRVATISKVSADRESMWRATAWPPDAVHDFIREAWVMTGREPLAIELPKTRSPGFSWPSSDPKYDLWKQMMETYAKLLEALRASNRSVEHGEMPPTSADAIREWLDDLITQAWKLAGKPRPEKEVSIEKALMAATEVLSPPELKEYPHDPGFWHTLILGQDESSQPVVSSPPLDPSFHYQAALLQSLSGRKFFVTAEDGDMGMALYEIQPGDIICLFPGALVPFVLRPFPSAQQYTLIGECYCHSWMDGTRGERLVRERQLEQFRIF